MTTTKPKIDSGKTVYVLARVKNGPNKSMPVYDSTPEAVLDLLRRAVAKQGKRK